MSGETTPTQAHADTDAPARAGGVYPWQDGLWSQLDSLLASARLGHALLFTGAPGVGKTHLARQLAASLLCAEPGARSLACGHCRACRQLAAGAHPDFVELAVAEDRQSILVDQVRRFSHTLHLRPQYAGARVGLIQPAERLHPNAANALLKTLEEPPQGSHILLVSARPSAVPATVRSRCQLVRVPLPRAEQLRGWAGAQSAAVAQALALARGAPLRALDMAEQDIARRQGRWLEALLKLVRGRIPPTELARDWQAQPLALVFDWLYLTCADLLKLQHGAPATALANQQQDHTLGQLAAAFDGERLRRALPRLIRARRLLDSNADTLLITEQLIMTLYACRSRAPNGGR